MKPQYQGLRLHCFGFRVQDVRHGTFSPRAHGTVKRCHPTARICTPAPGRYRRASSVAIPQRASAPPLPEDIEELLDHFVSYALGIYAPGLHLLLPWSVEHACHMPLYFPIMGRQVQRRFAISLSCKQAAHADSSARSLLGFGWPQNVRL